MADNNKKFEEVLKRKQMGYVMVNETMGIEIKCTEKYKEEWESRGFKVKEKKMISLLED